MSDRFDGSVGGWSTRGEAVPEDGPLPPERYRIDGLLGRGGMGEVYRAWDRHLEREVALKRTHVEGASLLAEARVAAQLDHAGIVPVLDFGTLADGTPFYTMRRVEGRTLDSVDPDPPQQVLGPLRAAVHAVAFAHDRGVVHRDLKPSNLMVGAFGETQVVDWGLACRVAESRPGRIGTPRYLAEEPRRGQAMGPADDVYALGATLVEVLTGRHAEDPAGWRVLAGSLHPPALAAIARRALAPLPERYPDASALARDLDAWFERRLVDAHDYSPLELALWLAWRLRGPLALGLVALLAGGGALLLTGSAILQERARAWRAEGQAREARDEADQLLSDALANQAVAALERGALPEALVLATRALERGESPRARGVTMAVGPDGLPPVSVLATGCAGRLFGTPSAWSCATDEGVVDPEGTRLHTGPVERVVPTSTGAWVATRRTLQHLPDGPVFDRAGLLAVRGDRAAQVMRDEVRWMPAGAGDLRVVRPCRDSRAERTFAWSAEGLWVPCEAGSLVRLDGEDVHVVLDGLGDEPVTAVAVAGEIWLGRAGRIDRFAMDGTALGSLVTGVRVVRRLELDPTWALVEGDRGGPSLVHRARAEAVLQLPTSWRGARLVDGQVVLAEAGDWHTLDLAALQPSLPLASAGVASIALDPTTDAVAAALGDGSVWTSAPPAEVVLHRGYVTKDVVYTARGQLFAANMQGEPYRLDPDGPVRVRTQGNPCRRLYAMGEHVWCVTYITSGPIPLGSEAATPQVQAVFVDAGGTPARVALLDDTGQVWLHDPSGLRPVARPLGEGAIRASATVDGHVAVGSEATIVWLGPDGKVRDHVEVGGVLRALAVSGGGDWVAAGLLDGRAVLWTVDDDRLHRVAWLEGIHDQRVSTLRVTDAGEVVTGGWDRRVHRWRPAQPSSTRASELERAWVIPLGSLLEEPVHADPVHADPGRPATP